MITTTEIPVDNGVNVEALLGVRDALPGTPEIAQFQWRSTVSWVNSYVAGDKIYCVHETDDADTVREHARRGGFPADVVVEVAAEFGPQTADR